MATNDVKADNGSGVIGLFGATGRTGKLFLQLALQENYAVKALVRTPEKLESFIGKDVPDLEVVQGSLDESNKVKQAVSGAKYIVCMVAVSGDDTTYPKGYMNRFVTSLLNAIENEDEQRVILYQAGSMSCDGDGWTHPLSFMAKHSYGRRLAILSKIQDNNDAIRQIANRSNGHSYIVTRAGVLVDGPPERPETEVNQTFLTDLFNNWLWDLIRSHSIQTILDAGSPMASSITAHCSIATQGSLLKAHTLSGENP